MSEQLIDIGSIIAIAALILSVITLYLNQRKTKKELELTKEYINVLSQLIGSYKRSAEAQQGLEERKLLWKQLEGIGKAFGWMIKHFEDEE
jgi:uncharacterized protein YoxC